jgi:predicted transcriptional regulator
MAEPKPKSVFQIPPDETAEARLDAEAEADCAAGRVVAHERVREWLVRLARGERRPPPET